MFDQLKQGWQGLGNLARGGLAAGIAAILAGMLFIGYWLLATDYQVLFAELDPQDAGAIVSELERMKVPHRLQEEGRTVLVDKAEVYGTRLKLMSKGVNLRGTVGFELFSDADIGMTEFAQKINYQRAMQGELARTIMALDEVRAARVHLVIPESGLLRRGDAHGKASITITTRPGKQLQAAQVAGIRRLVAAAVPQIEPDAVTLLDSRGVALSPEPESLDGAGTGASPARLELKRQTESYFIQKAAAVLDRAIGPGRAIVTVDVALNHDMLKVTREQVLAAPAEGGGALLRSRQTSQKEGRPRSAPGAPQPEAATGSAQQNESSVAEFEYQHGKRIEQMVAAPGAVRRISVAVVVPDALPVERMQRLTDVVGMAVGLNPGRGDGIAVYSMEQLAGTSGGQQDDAVPLAPGMSGMPDAVAARPSLHADTRKGAAADHAANVPASPNLQRRQEIRTDRTLPVLAGLLLAALPGLAALLWWRQRQAGAHRLSEQARREMLRDLQDWLAPAAARSRQ